MNHITFGSRLEVTMQLYAAFIPYCDTEHSQIAILNEIRAIKSIINEIDTLSVSVAKNALEIEEYVFESKMNN